MDKLNLPPKQQAFVDRFTAACQSDDRILAAFIGGSYAWGTADLYSDIDIYLVISDDALDDFNATRDQFLRTTGDPLFRENFDLLNIIFLIFADGVEVELSIGRGRDFSSIHAGPHITLLDKKGFLEGAEFQAIQPDPVDQTEKLRRLVYWFWHDFSHFLTAMERGQFFWAQGQLEVLRRVCVNLTRLVNDFLDPDVGDDPYFKLEKAVPVEQLAGLKGTYCALEKGAMIAAAMQIVRLYREIAPQLARRHQLHYPESLERIMVQRMEDLRENTR